MEFHVVGVDLRNDERHLRIHSECRRFVDRNRIGLTRDRNMASGDIAARAEERDVDFVEGSGIEFFDGDGIAAELNEFPD